MKFDMGKAWNDTVAILSANREVLLVLAGVFFLLPALASGLLMDELEPMPTPTPQQALKLLSDYLAAKHPLPPGLGTVAAEHVHFELFDIENRQQINQAL